MLTNRWESFFFFIDVGVYPKCFILLLPIRVTGLRDSDAFYATPIKDYQLLPIRVTGLRDSDAFYAAPIKDSTNNQIALKQKRLT